MFSLSRNLLRMGGPDSKSPIGSGVAIMVCELFDERDLVDDVVDEEIVLSRESTLFVEPDDGVSRDFEVRRLANRRG